MPMVELVVGHMRCKCHFVDVARRVPLNVRSSIRDA